MGAFQIAQTRLFNVILLIRNPQSISNVGSKKILLTKDAGSEIARSLHPSINAMGGVCAGIMINTHPKYKSEYYEGGYPDDGYGVCTDLVAAALKGAGYDLRELVDQDIKEHPEDYNVETPDANIDYRRVKNLRVWFQNNAISCSLDLADIEDWQGGDIVIFENHIGIVSDHRNADGVPYVIHHNSPTQRSYEEDILEERTDLVGHYRIS